MRKLTFLLTFVLFVGFTASAQMQISGKVTNAQTGEPIPGVSVVVENNSSIGTSTDLDGNYSFEVPSDAEVLVFSFVGMQRVERVISGQTTIDVQMMPSIEEMEEVVVTAVGISKQQKALGYSMSSVNEGQLADKSEPDIIKNLQGKVSGVDIRGSGGSPGSATRITIRGNSSLFSDNQPLIVVDGIPYSNDQYNTTSQNTGGGAYGTSFSTLDPNNIKDVRVLKGAAASALYGSRAANGVLLIETKSGSASASMKDMEVSFTSEFTAEEIANLPEYQNTYGAGVDFKYANANGSWGPRFDARDSIPNPYLGFWPELQDYYDWDDQVPWDAAKGNVQELFRTGMVFENSLNIRGGNKNSTLSLTASNLNNDGYIPESQFDRRSASLGGVTKLGNGLVARGNLSYSTTQQVSGIFGNNQAADENAASSFARALWLGRSWDWIKKYPQHPQTGEPLQPNGPSQFDNPIWSWNHNQVVTDADRITANIKLGYDITDDLSLSYQFGSNTFMQRRQQVIDKGSTGYEGKGGIIDDDLRRNEIESNFLVNYDKDVTQDINLTLTAGHNLNQIVFDRQAFQGKDIIARGIYDLDNTKNLVPYGGDFSKQRLWGLLYDASISYKSYIFLNASGRNDWSSTLPQDNNSYFYPAFSTSFIFTDAFNMSDDVLNFGKLRASWAKTGNDASPYVLSQVYEIGTPFLGQATQEVPNSTFASDLNPEFTTEIEVGGNLEFFDSRIKLDVSWYDRRTTDQIVGISLPGTTGYTSFVTNAGEVQNTGVEATLSLTPIKTSNGFQWDIISNFTRNQNIIAELPEGYDRITLAGLFGDPSIVFEEDEPYGIMRGSVAARDDQGNLLINSGTGILIREDDYQTIGDPNPDFRMGVTNQIKFKGFTFSALVDYKQGGDLYSSSISSMLGRGVTKDTEDREHSYILPGYYGDPNTNEPMYDAEGNKIPNQTQVDLNSFYFGDSFAINGISEFQVYDATVVRLSQVSVGYTLPRKWFSNLPLGSMNISFQGNNLWYFAPGMPKYTNFDPEVNGYGATNVQGVEYSIAPTVSRYGFSIKMTL